MSNGFWSFAGNYWWLLFVFGGTIGGAVRSMGRASERRAERRQERFRLKQEARIAAAQAGASTAAAETTQRRVLTRVTEQHDKTNARWLDYELDPVTLIEFPMLTDMREPLTVASTGPSATPTCCARSDPTSSTEAPRASIATPSTTTPSPSRWPRPRPAAAASATSASTSRPASSGPSVCSGGPPTRRRRRPSASRPTPRRGPSSTG